MTAMETGPDWLSFGSPVELKARGDGWQLTGYASTWDTDLQQDRLEPGAFRRSLASGRRIRFLYAHRHDKVLGVTKVLREDGQGLWGEWMISKTELGADVRQLVLDGAVDSFSIGFLPKDFVYDRDGVRVLKDVDLVEVSLVTMPANPLARVASVKAAAARRPQHPQVAQLEALVQRLRTWELIDSLSDAERRGYALVLKHRMAQRLAGGR